MPRGKTKLTPSQVFAIKQALVAGTRGKDLAAQYHVSGATITFIKQGRRWGHIKASKDTDDDIHQCGHCKGKGIISSKQILRREAEEAARYSSVWEDLGVDMRVMPDNTPRSKSLDPLLEALAREKRQ